MTSGRLEIWKQGAEAAQAGTPLEDNPHADGTEAFAAWRSGWTAWKADRRGWPPKKPNPKERQG